MRVVLETNGNSTTLRPLGRVAFEKRFTKFTLGCVIPCFDCGKFIGRALRSLNSSVIPLEIVVVIDQRKTKILREIDALLRKLRVNVGVLRVVGLDENWGLATARNVGVSYLESDMFLTLDADNKIYSHRLAEARTIMDERNADFGFGPLAVKGGSIPFISATTRLPELSYPPTNLVDAMAIYRKSSFEELGGFRPLSIQGHEDYDFWVRTAVYGSKVVSFEFFLGEYFARSDSMINSIDNDLKAQAMDEIARLNPTVSWLG